MNLKAEKILSKLFPDINWLTKIEHPLRIFIGFFLKYPPQFVPGFAVVNGHIPMNWRKSPNSISGPLIILLVSTIMASSTKKLAVRVQMM